jgi:lysophospholipid acyltransferase (LPLAT)-like uncharacterized protein
MTQVRRKRKKRPITGFIVRRPALMTAVGAATAAAMHLWLGSLRVHTDVAEPSVDPRRRPRRVILCLWHEDLLLLSYYFRHNGIHTLISDSADGEWIARGLSWLGYGTVRGSSGPSGGRAVLRILRERQAIDLAVTPDGPLGPRRKFHMGAVYLASRLGMALVPLSCGYERPRRTRSWDRLVLPRPFSRQVICVGRELFVPPDADAQTLETYRSRAESDLEANSARAQELVDHWVSSGNRSRAAC